MYAGFQTIGCFPDTSLLCNEGRMPPAQTSRKSEYCWPLEAQARSHAPLCRSRLPCQTLYPNCVPAAAQVLKLLETVEGNESRWHPDSCHVQAGCAWMALQLCAAYDCMVCAACYRKYGSCRSHIVSLRTGWRTLLAETWMTTDVLYLPRFVWLKVHGSAYLRQYRGTQVMMQDLSSTCRTTAPHQCRPRICKFLRTALIFRQTLDIDQT